MNLPINSSSPWGESPVDTQRIDLFVAPNDPLASDLNNGSQGLPLATLDEAIRRVNRIRLVAAPVVVHLASGTYTIADGTRIEPHVLRSNLWFIGDGAGQDGDDGWTELLSDTAQAGTTASALATSGGLVTDELIGKQLIIDTGDAAGYRKTINRNDAALIVPSAQLTGIAEGDAFRVVEPAVVINLPSPTLGADTNPEDLFRIEGCSGGGIPPTFGGPARYLAFHNIRFDADPTFTGVMVIQRSDVQFFGCEMSVAMAGPVLDPYSTLLAGVDSAMGASRVSGAVEIGLAPAADSRAWGGYGLFFDGGEVLTGGRIEAYIHATGRVDIFKTFGHIYGGSVKNTADNAIYITDCPRGVYIGEAAAGGAALTLPFYVLCEDPDANAATIRIGGLSAVFLGAVELIKDAGGACIWAGADGSQGFGAPTVGMTEVSLEGRNDPSHAVVVTNGGRINFRSNEITIVGGFGVGTQFAVHNSTISGALVEQQDLGAFASGDAIPAAVTSDGRDGFIQRN